MRASATDEAARVQALIGWFATHARVLPWRARVGGAGWNGEPGSAARDPYASLVSEFMLQQTQVSRVVEFFPRFMARFPTVADLAAAPEVEVMAAWAGLGYYRRARHLHAAAKRVVAEFGGRVPASVAELRTLPGVGRYTAGAIASIVFGVPEPALDGNVARVLLRLQGEDLVPDATETTAYLWEVAGRHVAAAVDFTPGGAGVWNEALMELGATVCVPPPAEPRCGDCPLAASCRARASGTQGQIPRPKARAKVMRLHVAVIVIRDREGRIRLEQRGEKGLWAGLWQPPTIEQARAIPESEVAALAAMRGGGAPQRVGGVGQFTHQLTHRYLAVTVYAAAAVACRVKAKAGTWADAGQLASLGLSTMHHKAIESARTRVDRR